MGSEILEEGSMANKGMGGGPFLRCKRCGAEQKQPQVRNVDR